VPVQRHRQAIIEGATMNLTNRPSALLIALAAGALLTAGCDQRAPAGSTQAKVDQAANKVGAAVSNAADKTAAATDDAAITAKVKAALLAEPGLKSTQINVDTNGATVVLTGNVDTADMRERAKQVASSTSGVKNVVDQMTVKAS
jgi:osmotically-inducible protein OsmY